MDRLSFFFSRFSPERSVTCPTPPPHFKIDRFSFLPQPAFYNSPLFGLSSPSLSSFQLNPNPCTATVSPRQIGPYSLNRPPTPLPMVFFQIHFQVTPEPEPQQRFFGLFSTRPWMSLTPTANPPPPTLRPFRFQITSPPSLRLDTSTPSAPDPPLPPLILPISMKPFPPPRAPPFHPHRTFLTSSDDF